MRTALLTALAGFLVVAPAGVAGVAAAAPAAPAAGHDRPPAAKHDQREKPPKPSKHDAASPSPSPTPTPSASPSATPTAAPTAAPTPEGPVLGPTVPSPIASSSPRLLSGQTLGALSYDAPEPLPVLRPGRASTRAAAPPTIPVAAAWTRHGRAEWPTVATSVRAAVDHPTAPLLVAVLILLFVLVQHRIDGRDPKLSHGHLADGPDLRFGPPLRGPAPP